MNKRNIVLIGLLVLLVAGFGAYKMYQMKQADPGVLVAGETVKNSDLDIEFKYPGGENGFVLLEPDGTEKGILKSYLMLPKAEYDSYKTVEGPSEAPASMNIFIFELEDEDEATSTSDTIAASPTGTSTPRESRITELQNWATDNSGFTSINLAKNTPEVVEIDDIKALHYQADGLYQQDIYLVSYKDRVYMFVGQYNEVTDQTYTSFQELIKSISFG